MASTPKARGAGGRAEGRLGDVELVREGGILVNEVLALGGRKGLLTEEIIDLVTHALHHAVVLVGGGMPRRAFGGARASRMGGGGEGVVEGAPGRRGGRGCWDKSRDVNILPAGAGTRGRQVNSRRRGARGEEGSKVVVPQGRMLETLGDVQGVEERRGSGSGSASVRKGGSRSGVRGNGGEESGFTPHDLVRAAGGA